jgi:hypothetical protein
MELGKATMVGNNAVEQTLSIPKPPVALKRVLIDANHDVLAVEE